MPTTNISKAVALGIVDEALAAVGKEIIKLTLASCHLDELLKRTTHVFFGLIPKIVYVCAKHGERHIGYFDWPDHRKVVCTVCWHNLGKINDLERVQDTFKEWRALVLEAKDDGDVTFDPDDIESLRSWAPRKEET
jgi:hypothetical protein